MLLISYVSHQVNYIMKSCRRFIWILAHVIESWYLFKPTPPDADAIDSLQKLHYKQINKIKVKLYVNVNIKYSFKSDILSFLTDNYNIY